MTDQLGESGATQEPQPDASHEERPDGSLKKIAAIVGGATAIVVATGALAKAVVEVVDIFTDDATTVAQTASVVVGDPLLQGSSAVFDTDVTVSGRKDQQIRVVWTLMDVERGRPVDEEGFTRQPVASFKSGADTVERSFQASAPAPSSTDFVFLRVELLDEAGERFEFGDSDRLRLGGLSP